jgi:hypothetical protein
MKTYFLGARIGSKKTIILEARRNIDYLSCELIEFLGEREITKDQLKLNAKNPVMRDEICKRYNDQIKGVFSGVSGYNFTKVRID